MFAGFLVGPNCVSPMLADGSVAYSGPGRTPAGTFALLVGIHGGGYVLPGLRAGEASSSAVAVATGGRAVLAVTGIDGAVRLHAWAAGGRTPLTVPAGWRVSRVVELGDDGVVLANLTSADGTTTRPAVWHTGA